MIDWKAIRHFTPSEFQKPECLRPEMIYKFDLLRDMCGFGFVITSSYRDPAHNANVGGAPNSSHCLASDGLYSGIDFTVPGLVISSHQLDAILKHSYELGFRRRGMYLDMRHVHLDLEPLLAQDVTWIDKA